MIIVRGLPVEQTVSERHVPLAEWTASTEVELSAFAPEQRTVSVAEMNARYKTTRDVVNASCARREASEAMRYWEQQAEQLDGPEGADATVLAWLARTELDVALEAEHEALAKLGGRNE